MLSKKHLSGAQKKKKNKKISSTVHYLRACPRALKTVEPALAPQLGLQQIATAWWGDLGECPFIQPRLLVCSGMLLIVDDYLSPLTSGLSTMMSTA
jgi:hypothetical protein